MVAMNGSTTGFTGVGTPNPKLNITQKAQMDQAGIRAMLQIEQWANNLQAAGSGYASLTGPGQTTSPGELTQQGDFVVDSNSTVGIDLNATTGPIDISSTSSTHGIVIQSNGGGTGGIVIDDAGTDGITITETGVLGNSAGINVTDTTTGGVNILGSGAGGVTITGSVGNGLNLSGGGGGIFIGTSSFDDVGFFGQTPANRPTVTGSRGGNAALASLLTALATLGLIVDSSTP